MINVYREDNSHRCGSRCWSLINMLEEASIAEEVKPPIRRYSAAENSAHGSRCPLECV